jgi:hypothetical protein
MRDEHPPFTSHGFFNNSNLEYSPVYEEPSTDIGRGQLLLEHHTAPALHDSTIHPYNSQYHNHTFSNNEHVVSQCYKETDPRTCCLERIEHSALLPTTHFPELIPCLAHWIPYMVRSLPAPRPAFSWGSIDTSTWSDHPSSPKGNLTCTAELQNKCDTFLSSALTPWKPDCVKYLPSGERTLAPSSKARPKQRHARAKQGPTSFAHQQFRCQLEMGARSCDKSFRRPEHLKRHIRTVHREGGGWICKIAGCQKSISRANNLLDHYWTHIDKGDGSGRNERWSLEVLSDMLLPEDRDICVRLGERLHKYWTSKGIVESGSERARYR